MSYTISNVLVQSVTVPYYTIDQLSTDVQKRRMSRSYWL